MRTFVRGSLFIIVTGLIGGCGSSMGGKADRPTATHANGVAESKTCVMQSSGVHVLRLRMSPDTKCVAQDGELKLTSPQFEIEVLADRRGADPWMRRSDASTSKSQVSSGFQGRYDNGSEHCRLTGEAIGRQGP